MNETAISQYIIGAFPDVESVTVSGDTFFFNDPAKMFPFATMVTSDTDGAFSDLGRPSVFRFNIGVGKHTFQSLFPPKATGEEETAHDFTALDRIMPHPVYGKMYWICVLNPSEETFIALKTLLAEAYDLSAKRLSNTKQTNDAQV
ncbi:DUF6194 family protein [Zavarzinella formosa]|uniref:DUF6194 family protein n=1 Tax=Zavarzinella formosa TaxID=360055 RepID=UPI0002E5A3DD|nr:DUF6194 family protein [Zavarzinella formosa]